ncbi:MAG: FkbM family methyltransferase, partial [Microgenomates group bacterium]
IEPNPSSYELLEQNIFENQLTDIETFQCALSEVEGETLYYREKTKNHWHSTGGFIEGAWTNQQESESFVVETHTLSEFIQEPIDLLKMDIEGAEQAVLKSAGDSLKMVKELLLEFHPHRKQSLEEILKILEPYFKTTLFKDGKEVQFTKARGLLHIHGKSRFSQI